MEDRPQNHLTKKVGQIQEWHLKLEKIKPLFYFDTENIYTPPPYPHPPTQDLSPNSPTIYMHMFGMFVKL